MALRLSTGARNAMLSNHSYPTHLYTAATISFEDGTGAGGNDKIVDSGSGLGNFVVGDYISVAGSTSNNVSGVKVLVASAGELEIAADSLTTEAAGDQVIIGAGAGGGSFDEIFRDGVMDIYSGSQPSDADSGETGTKLVRITVGSGAFVAGSPTNGLNFADASSGSSDIDSSETWSGVGLADGTAGWFRFYSNAATTGSSTTAVRFDGSCGVGTGDLQMSSTSVSTGATTTVDSGSMTLPASA